MNDNKIDNDKYNELIKVYKEYKKNKKKKIEYLFKLKFIVFSYYNVFSNKIFSIIIFR